MDWYVHGLVSNLFAGLGANESLRTNRVNFNLDYQINIQAGAQGWEGGFAKV